MKNQEKKDETYIKQKEDTGLNLSKSAKLFSLFTNKTSAAADRNAPLKSSTQ